MEITLYPEGREKKKIQQRYARAGFTVLICMVIFQGVSRLVQALVGLIDGASLSECYAQGQKIILSNEISSTFFSIGFPIIAEITAIIIGSKLLGINFKNKKLWNRDGYDLKDIAGSATVMFFCQSAASVILVLIYLLIKGDTSEATENVIMQRNTFWVNIILYFYVCIFGPLLEEMIYRGIVLESIRPYNEKFAVVFSALIFALMHGNLAQCINAFMAGIVLGIIYARTRSLLPSVILHIIMNTVTSVFSVMLYSDPNILEHLTNMDLSALQGFPMTALILNALLRIVTFFAGIVVIIITAGKGFGLRRPKPEGKKRAAPLVWTSAPWIVVIVCYIAIIAINF